MRSRPTGLPRRRRGVRAHRHVGALNARNQGGHCRARRDRAQLASASPPECRACARLRGGARPCQGAGLARRGRIDCPLVELEDFPDHADLAVECAPAKMLEKICTPMLKAGKQVMVLSAGALLPRPIWSRSPGSMAARSSCRPAHCSASTRFRCGGRQHPFGADDHPQAAERPRRRALSRRARHLGRRPQRRRSWYFPAPHAKPPPASRQCQRGGGAFARRHRTRPHHHRDLGRSRGDAELPRDRGRCRFRAVLAAIENIPSENPKTGRITALR